MVRCGFRRKPLRHMQPLGLLLLEPLKFLAEVCRSSDPTNAEKLNGRMTGVREVSEGGNSPQDQNGKILAPACYQKKTGTRRSP